RARAQFADEAGTRADVAIDQREDGSGEGEAYGEEEDGRDGAEGVLDQDKRRAPDKGVAGQCQVRRVAAVHLPLPPRMSRRRVRRMRLRPRSRPSVRYHSAVVCAPPPMPPAPMAMAGMPSESGMLASVEEQSRCERMPRWESTERIY